VGAPAGPLISTREPVFAGMRAWRVLGEGLWEERGAGAARVLTAVIRLYLPAPRPARALERE